MKKKTLDVMKKEIMEVKRAFDSRHKKPKDKRAKIVTLAEKHKLMRIEGLWLTSGGRIVKPGWGEYAEEKWGDILLMTSQELEDGIKQDEFVKRITKARRKWKRRKV